MGRCITVTSGKGGVGKTTTTANLGMALAMNGKNVCLVDADIGLRNLDIVRLIVTHPGLGEDRQPVENRDGVAGRSAEWIVTGPDIPDTGTETVHADFVF